VANKTYRFKLLFFFLTANIIIYSNKQVSAQDEQRLVKEGLQIKVPYISGTPKKLLKQTLPKRGPFLISFLEKDTLQLSTICED
jgi:hypothetical protein